MDFVGNATPLDPGDIDALAQKLGIEPATIWAVCDVESAGSGFLKDNRPKILFEAHSFHTLTRGRYDHVYPNVSSPFWDRTLYGAGGAHQYDRLDIAISLDRAAALESASWGKFQIMGSNHRAVGYQDVETFVTAMMDDEENHLEAFGEFCKTNHLIGYLRDHDWSRFTLRYNGSGQVPYYSTKLAQAYAIRATTMAPQNPSGPSGILQSGSYGPSVMALQQDLVRLGYQITPDGDFGPRTNTAVIDFQKHHHLVADGKVGLLTQAAITAALP